MPRVQAHEGQGVAQNAFWVNRPCIIPVAAAYALAWAAGRLNDADILLRSELYPNAIFVVNIPCRASLREMILAGRHWQSRGACTLITRTTPEIARQLTARGMQTTFVQANGQIRLMAPPEKFFYYFKRGKTAMSP